MPPPTIGMQIDNVLERLNHLSSTQLYVMTVTVMALATFLILSPAGTPLLNSDEVPVAVVKTTKAKAKAVPAIHGYLRMINFIGLACFLASLVAFFNSAEAYSSSSPIVYRFLIGWCAYLAYFFSFNGVSIIYDNLDPVVAEETTTNHNNTTPYAAVTRYASVLVISVRVCVCSSFHKKKLTHSLVSI